MTEGEKEEKARAKEALLSDGEGSDDEGDTRKAATYGNKKNEVCIAVYACLANKSHQQRSSNVRDQVILSIDFCFTGRPGSNFRPHTAASAAGSCVLASGMNQATCQYVDCALETRTISSLILTPPQMSDQCRFVMSSSQLHRARFCTACS